MTLVVNHNLMSANVARNLNSHYARLGTSTQRLSTGQRINSGADDAAGLAIRELQRADITALHQGARNANDAISLIQTADGAMGVIDEKLIRMKELAEQAATGTYNSTQRLMIESEYQQMASEITRIANATDFNGVKLLDGTLSAIGGSNKDGAMNRVKYWAAKNGFDSIYDANNAGAAQNPAGYVTKDAAGNDVLTAEGRKWAEKLHDGAGKNENGVDDLDSVGALKVHFGGGNDSAEDYYYIEIGDSRAFALGVGNYYKSDQFGTKETGHSDKIDGRTVSTQKQAQKAILAINEAIISKDKIRAHLGAIQNRLENTITNIQVQAENLQASESRISDVDVATEMTEFTRNQILTQTAVAMLAQANALPQMALQLIGG